ncbi:steroid delta-isomerase [Flavobacteriaceae bacterium R38]|nr:steroid delta-isomerase [Flavobacteriaceae bacterium R38]
MLKKHITSIFFLLIGITAFAQSKSNQELKNDEIVSRQVEAYNKGDYAAFEAFYTDDIEFYEYPDQLIFKGKKAFKERFSKRFSDAKVHCEVKNKILLGNTVIYEEYITTSDRKYTVLGVYEMENGKIKKLTFIRK